VFASNVRKLAALNQPAALKHDFDWSGTRDSSYTFRSCPEARAKRIPTVVNKMRFGEGGKVVGMGHSFGGPWTENKLKRIDNYLDAYMTIFTGNSGASKLNTIYLDAFAGTGFRTSPGGDDLTEGLLFEDALEDPDADSLKKGSAYVALRTKPPFDRYIFVDQNPKHAESLATLRQAFPELAHRIAVEVADANTFLQDWCQKTDWKKDRAVVFLDPYGMQVDWSTIETIATTKAIDLWILFPLGQAVNRLLTRNGIPEGRQAQRLTRFFGTEDWKEAFYEEAESQLSIFDDVFGEETGYAKRTNFDAIGRFFVSRLEMVFAGVCANPLPLRNSKGVPLFLLCFAVANPKAVKPALSIANFLLKR
jgi:three-Cys-motif partner protein